MRLCTVEELEKVLSHPGDNCLIDVREDAEFRSERIRDFSSLPLSRLPGNLQALPGDKPIYVVCRSGSRARRAAEILERAGRKDVRVLDGGIRAWASAARQVEKGTSRVWSLDRQVRFAAGALVLTGVALSLTLHPAWVALSAFVAAGLMFSAVTDTCGMAFFLSKMPWNRV